MVYTNDYIVKISSEYFIKKPSINENIPYTLVSLIIHDGDSLDSGNFVGYISDANTGIWCHCDDTNVT